MAEKLSIYSISCDLLIEKGHKIPENSGYWYCIIHSSDEKSKIIGMPVKNKSDVIDQLVSYRSNQTDEYRIKISDLENKLRKLEVRLDSKEKHERIIEICSVIIASSALFPIIKDLFGFVSDVKKTLKNGVTEIYKIHIIDYGIIQSETETEVVDENSPTGKHRILKHTRIIKKTTKIPASKKTEFGILYIVEGFPEGEKVNLVLKWLHPAIKHYKTEKLMYSTSRQFKATIGKTHTHAYRFGSESDPVPGKWTIQVFYDGKLAAEKIFTVLNPEDNYTAFV